MSTYAAVLEDNYLTNKLGWKSWFFTKDHKRIALLFLITVTFFFFVGGTFATLMRLELMTPQGDLFTSETYNKLFSMHGIIMVWFFSHSVDSDGFRKFSHSDDDWSARSGIPPVEPVELVPAGDRRALCVVRDPDRRRGYGMDVLCPVQQSIREYSRRRRSGRDFHFRIFVHPDGLELHRDHP
jgi:hypothetical protein